MTADTGARLAACVFAALSAAVMAFHTAVVLGASPSAAERTRWLRVILLLTACAVCVALRANAS